MVAWQVALLVGLRGARAQPNLGLAPSVPRRSIEIQQVSVKHLGYRFEPQSFRTRAVKRILRAARSGSLDVGDWICKRLPRGREQYQTQNKGEIMASDSHILSVYKTGPLTVVGFGGQEVLDQVNISACREEILELVANHKTEILAFDLTGVKFVPSGLLGLLASLRHQNVKIQIYNPSDDVQEVLEITHLNQVLEVCHVEI